MRASFSRNVLLLAVFAAALRFAASPLPASADAPFEAFHVVFTEALAPVLRATVGILVIGPAGHDDLSKQALAIPVFAKRGGAFTQDGARKLFAEAIPLSSYGYGEPGQRAEVASRMGLGGCRFPVTAWEGEHAQIVVDPSAGTRVWVSLKGLAKEFGVQRIPLERLHKYEKFAMVDLFCFTRSLNRKVYDKPDRAAVSRVIAKKENRYAGKFFVVKEIRGEFLKIEVRQGDDGRKPFEVFWVRLRDDAGTLMVWPVTVDPC